MGRRILDLAAASACAAVFGIAWIYADKIAHGMIILWVSGVLTVGCVVLAVCEKRNKENKERKILDKLPSEQNLITEIVLLSEEDTELMVWNLYGKTSALIGRAVKNSLADIDLGEGPYASMVETEHAVLNFSGGNWYVEDLGSTNGLRIKKNGGTKIYHLSQDAPCKLEKGDCLYVGMNRLLLR